MIEEGFIQVVSSLGFPVAVCLWFMLRTEKIIKSNTAAFIQIGEVIRRCPAAKY